MHDMRVRKGAHANKNTSLGEKGKPTFTVLGGREVLGTGLGLGAFKLIRLPREGSPTEDGRPAGGLTPAPEGLRVGTAAGLEGEGTAAGCC